jgi:coenzyme F420 hydrogenase subunit beta
LNIVEQTITSKYHIVSILLVNVNNGELTMTSNTEQTMNRARRWLKENTKRYAFKKLEREIIKTEVCTECGACVANCPVDALTGDTSSGKYVPTLTGKCVACGTCYAICPRTVVLWKDLVGNFRSIWKARSLLENKRQNGGIATALLSYMVDQKIVDGAVVTTKSYETPWMPVTKLITTKDDLEQIGGTIYTHAPVVQELMKGIKEGKTTLAIVGTSCNIDAVNNMQEHPSGFFSVDLRTNVFKIGLFCMESFDYPRLKEFLTQEGVDIADVTRFEIAGGKFKINTSKEEREWPVADLNPVAAKSCSYCLDLTCKNADISCGNIGSDDEWTTVIVRSIRGEHIFQELLAEEMIEAEMLDEKSIQTIQNIARGKATRYYKMDPLH